MTRTIASGRVRATSAMAACTTVSWRPIIDARDALVSTRSVTSPSGSTRSLPGATIRATNAPSLATAGGAVGDAASTRSLGASPCFTPRVVTPSTVIDQVSASTAGSPASATRRVAASIAGWLYAISSSCSADAAIGNTRAEKLLPGPCSSSAGSTRCFKNAS